MPPSGIQIYFGSRVTLTFDLLTPKFIVSCPVDHSCQLASKSVYSFSKYRVHMSLNRRTNGWTNGQTTWEHYVSACQSGLAETRLYMFLNTASTDKIRLSWTRYGWHIYTLRQLLNVFTVFWHNKPWYQCQRQALSSHSTYLPAPVTSLLPSYYWYNLCLVTGRY